MRYLSSQDFEEIILSTKDKKFQKDFLDKYSGVISSGVAATDGYPDIPMKEVIFGSLMIGYKLRMREEE